MDGAKHFFLNILLKKWLPRGPSHEPYSLPVISLRARRTTNAAKRTVQTNSGLNIVPLFRDGCEALRGLNAVTA